MRKVVTVVLVLVALVVAALVIDTVARRRAEAVVAAELAQSLTGLRGADVTITGTPFLTQLAAGRFDLVDVTADAMRVGELELRSVHLVLTDVTRDEPTAGTLEVTAVVGPEALAAAQPGFSYTIEGDTIVASLPDAPLAAVIRPTARGEAIALEVIELRLGGAVIAPEDLPLGLGDAFEDLSVPLPLPEGLTLTAVTVAEPAIQVSVSGRDVRLTAPD